MANFTGTKITPQAIVLEQKVIRRQFGRHLSTMEMDT